MWAIVPVKRLERSKARLAPVLAPVQRARFTEAMLRDVLDQLGRVEILTGVGVLSADTRVQGLAHQMGVRVWSDKAEALNPGLQAVAGDLSAVGFGMMVVPCDVPEARAEDYRALLARHAGAGGGVTLVAASADGGTNALLRDAELDFSFHFGAGSFDAHVQEARAKSIQLNVAEQPRLARDIDRPEDLRWLLASDHDCRARDYLRQVLGESMGNGLKKTA